MEIKDRLAEIIKIYEESARKRGKFIKRKEDMDNTNEEFKKMSEEEFIINAIKNLRKSPYKGIHSVFSGFNEAFRVYFEKDPVAITKRLADEGKVVVRPVKGGVILYLPGDAAKNPKPNEVIKIITGESKPRPNHRT